MWTLFEDTQSGGYPKTPHEVIAIEAPEAEAVRELERRWPGVFAYGEACECCCADFRITTTDDEPGDDVFKVCASEIPGSLA